MISPSQMPISHENWIKLLSVSGASSSYFFRSASVNTNDRSRSPFSRGISGTVCITFHRRAIRRALRKVARQRFTVALHVSSRSFVFALVFVAGTSSSTFLGIFESVVSSRVTNAESRQRGLPSRYFQDELFNRRNRIAHWGYVNSTKQEAEHSHQIAVAIVTILREMDRLKHGIL